MSKLKTVKKWEAELNVKINLVQTDGDKVMKIACYRCQEFENSISCIAGFSRAWIEGTTSVKKDSLIKHVNGESHKRAINLKMKKDMGASEFANHLLKDTALGRGLVKMASDDKEIMRLRFNTAYYIAKSERPFTDACDLITLQEKNGIKKSSKYRDDRAASNFVDIIGSSMKNKLAEELKNCRYFSLLMDGSTDSSVIELEAVYVLYLSETGLPKISFLGVEAPNDTTSSGLKSCLDMAFGKLEQEEYYRKLVSVNLDGASVNMGHISGLGKLIQDNSPWCSVVHCFNHCLELAVKDSFKGTYFNEVDKMLTKLYYLYQKSPKRLKELREFGNAFDKSIPKPTKAYGTRWIDHKLRAMEIILNNYGCYILHLDSLSQSDSNSDKREEILGLVAMWKKANMPMMIALSIDILKPLRSLSLTFQREAHDPVLAFNRIRKFDWSMCRLQRLMDRNLFDTGSTKRLFQFTEFKKNCEIVEHPEENLRHRVTRNEQAESIKEIELSEPLRDSISTCYEAESKYMYSYQGVQLSGFNSALQSVHSNYSNIIKKLISAVSDRFDGIIKSVLFDTLTVILNVSNWPKDDEVLKTFGERELDTLRSHYNDLLLENGCELSKIEYEWDRLKIFIKDMQVGCPKYMEVWQKVFLNPCIKADCRNVLHLIEILLVTPFTNAKVERMFSTMNRVKTTLRNRLASDKLEHILRIGDVGPSIEEFQPDEYIESWFQTKARRIKAAKPHKYPQNRASIFGNVSTTVPDQYGLSDLESSSDESQDA